MTPSDPPLAVDPDGPDPSEESDPLYRHDPNMTFDSGAPAAAARNQGARPEADSRVLLHGEAHYPSEKFNPSGRFELRDEVGRGGMGEVVSCSDLHLGREVVVKTLHAKYLDRPEVLARFGEEIRITGQLEHPGVVPVYDAGVMPDGRPYYVMPRIWGLTLRNLLDERPDPTEGRARLLKVFEQVCETIAYAHAQRVVHRDLNPSNIMVGLFGQVKVMDWGLAKSLDESHRSAPAPAPDAPETAGPPETLHAGHTMIGSIMGTLAYMPPEQARGETERLDERCDVFGLGALLCEILTGQPPYMAANAVQLLRRARRADLAGALARLDASPADADLVALAKACLAGDPARRPRDAGAVLERLTHYFEMVLRQAESDLVRFFDLSLDLFCIAGFDGHFRRVNDNFSRVLGYSPAELTVKPFMHYVHPDDHGPTTDVMSCLLRGDPIARFRNRYRDARGEYRWFEWTAKSLPVEDVIFAAAREVTEEVALLKRLVELEVRAAVVPRSGAGGAREGGRRSEQSGSHLQFVQFLPVPGR